MLRRIALVRENVTRHVTLAVRSTFTGHAATATLAAIFLVSAATHVYANGPILKGDDVWVTPCGGGSYDFEPIPAGKLQSANGDPSLQYVGGIILGGVPLTIDVAPVNNAPIDNVVEQDGSDALRRVAACRDSKPQPKRSSSMRNEFAPSLLARV